MNVVRGYLKCRFYAVGRGDASSRKMRGAGERVGLCRKRRPWRFPGQMRYADRRLAKGATMTKAEWLAATFPPDMLDFLKGKVSDRKLRLFACACVHRQWPLVPPIERDAVAVAERFADGQATEKELKEARSKCRMQPAFSGGIAAYKCATPTAAEAARLSEAWARHSLQRHRLDTGDPSANRTHAEEGAAHADLLRDIFGYRFRRVTLKPTLRTSTVLAVATGIYQEKAFDRMPILADALQDADCDNEDILTHCRNANQVHVRGCWVLDLLLGKG
jgi:hypothetical protein